MMAYQSNYVLSIISTQSNRPLREFAENGERTCVIPFGTEYKIRLKNKSYKRAKAKVYIDGMDIMSSGGYFVLNPNQTIDLERFVDSFNSGKRFKFVSAEEATKNGTIQDPTHEDNGKITVEFYEENTCGYTIVTSGAIGTLTFPKDSFDYCTSTVTNGTITPTSSTLSTTNGSITTNSSIAFNTTNAINSSTRSMQKTAGVTSEGANSNQQFYQATDFITNDFPSATISVRLRGSSNSAQSDHKIVPNQTKSPWSVSFESTKVTVYHNGKYFTDSTLSKVTLAGKKLKVENNTMNLEVELG